MAFLESILIGISFAAIPGPMFFEVVRRTLKNGFWSGALVSVGEFIGNFLLLLMISIGVGRFLMFDISKIILYSAGSLILIWLGVAAIKIKEHDARKPHPGYDRKNNSVFVGFCIATTSPIVIALWVSLSGSYLLRFATPSLAFLNIFLISFGFLIFFFALSGIIHFSRKSIPARSVVWLSRIFGAVLFAYGGYFAFEAGMLIVGMGT